MFGAGTVISENQKSPDIAINLPSFTEKEVLGFIQKQEAQGEVTRLNHLSRPPNR